MSQDLLNFNSENQLVLVLLTLLNIFEEFTISCKIWSHYSAVVNFPPNVSAK